MLDHTTFTQLDEVRPGPALAALLAADQKQTAAPGPTGRSPNATATGPALDLAALGSPASTRDPVAAMAAWQRLDSWVQAGLNDAILAVAGKAPRDELDDDWGREEVSAALRLPAGTAADRIDLARRLAWPLTATGTALQEGRITLRHATEIARALQPLDDDLARHAEAAILDKAPGRTAAQLARIARREALKHDPHGADQRHKTARAQRRIEFTPLPDGMAELRAILPADTATRLRTAIDHLAGRTRTAGDPRTIDQRRADALLTLTEHTVAGLTSLHPSNSHTTDSQAENDPPADRTQSPDTPPTGREIAALRVGVIAPLATLTGHADLPGELIGYGPIPPSLTRELASTDHAHWEKWITDPGGTVTDLGRRTYRPSARLAAIIRAANPTCVFPTCSQPAHRCDLDHLIPWAHGGDTKLSNLAPLCRRHHRAKHEAGWHLHRAPDGNAYHWTSPTGHHYTVPAHTYDTSTSTVDADETQAAAGWDQPLTDRRTEPANPRCPQRPATNLNREEELVPF